MAENSAPHPIPPLPEVDQHGGDELPSYEDLAQQNGPNSRFGRWRGWIEKRAAERYADLTPEDLHRRRQKGWGENADSETDTAGSPAATAPAHISQLQLHIQTDLSTPATPDGFPDSDIPLPSIGEPLSPTRLWVHQFGSRFLPHTTSPIRCLLPILNNSLLLIGHDDGLSVLNMFPKEWADNGLIERGPNDAEAHHIWVGEGVYQMSLLEAGSIGDGTPQGVVLALVGPEGDSPKDQETVRAIRMYNLASLVNLAKWAVVQQPGVLPLRLNGYASGKCTQGRQHKSIPQIARGLRNMKLDSPITAHPGYDSRESIPFFPANGSTPSSIYKPELHRSMTGDSSIDSSWDVVDDISLRWAADYIPLASPGTRLCGTSVLCYDLWRESNEQRRGAAYLAVVVKTNILLYHAPKGERAFRFVKEFYTPMGARSVAFIQQSVQDMTRSPSDVTPRNRGSSSNNSRHVKGISVGGASPFYPAQLSLFVLFEKKAGLIRIADSAVGEVELYDEGINNIHHLLLPSSNSSSLTRRHRSSWDGKGFVKDTKAPWIVPTKVTIPGPANRPSFSQSMYILTRGKHSHFLPYPLPANLPSTPPYRVIHWTAPPTHVQTRTCRPTDGTPPFLQLIAFGEDGIEVQELDLSSISQNKGKGREDGLRRAQTDVGAADCGFLLSGGHWDKQIFAELVPSPSPVVGETETISDLSTEELMDMLHAHEGVYGWVRKGHEDWRVIWLGSGNESGGQEEED